MNKDYSAPFDTMAKVITAGVFILLIAVLYFSIRGWKTAGGRKAGMWIRSAVLLPLVFVIVWSYLNHVTGYSIRGYKFIINRPVGKIEMKTMDILDCRQLGDADMNGTVRTFGVGGLFGYFGDYHNPAVGNMSFYATQQKNLVLIHTNTGAAMVFSPDDPAGLVHEINARNVPNN